MICAFWPASRRFLSVATPKYFLPCALKAVSRAQFAPLAPALALGAALDCFDDATGTALVASTLTDVALDEAMIVLSVDEAGAVEDFTTVLVTLG